MPFHSPGRVTVRHEATGPEHRIAFGPVPSRRLGQSLGINNVPRKHCTYSCVYCQLGATRRTQLGRRDFFRPQQVVEAVTRRVELLRGRGEQLDHLTFVPDGEPTLDVGLGEAIWDLRRLGVPIAVITNGSLLRDREVCSELAAADWVSVKVDAVDDSVWHRINRPDPGLDHGQVLDGLRAFASSFQGQLVTETMILAGVNDAPAEIEAIARFVGGLRPAAAQLNSPVRPPADPTQHAASHATLQEAGRVFAEEVERVELLGRGETGGFASVGRFESDLLGLTAVHPLREDQLIALVANSGGSWDAVERLLAEGCVVRREHGGERFYLNQMEPGSRPQPGVVDRSSNEREEDS